jgi:hypothetical protein
VPTIYLERATRASTRKHELTNILTVSFRRYYGRKYINIQEETGPNIRIPYCVYPYIS